MKIILDVKRIVGQKKYRLLYFWMSRNFIGVLLYRFESTLYNLFGKSYQVIRIIFLPMINILRSYSNIDIHYKAKIGGGLLILHPSIGIVISGKSIIGKNLTLTGGNIIGFKNKVNGAFRIGNNCELGANATIIGPLNLGDYIKIGASACVTKSFLESNIVLIGVPARKMI